MLVSKTDIDKYFLKKFLLNVVESSAPSLNPNGYGAMWESGCTKSAEKFNVHHIKSILKRYKSSRFFVLHLRFATSSIVNYENTHPFTFRDQKGVLLRGVHNGIISNMGNYVISDSYEFLRRITEKVKEGYSVTEAVKQTAMETDGTFSVVLHIPRIQKLYYFRNSRSFFFIKSNGMILGATHISRFYPLFNFEKERDIFPPFTYHKPIPGKIYEFDLNLFSVRIVDEFPVGEFSTYSYYSFNDSFD